MIAGEIYDPSDPELVSEARRALRLADEYQRIYLMDNHAARHVLVDLVGQLGEDVEIKPRCSWTTGPSCRSASAASSTTTSPPWTSPRSASEPTA